MNYQLPKLDFAFDALEPAIDARTMEIHYTKHHAAYIDKLNTVMAKYPQLDGSLEELMSNIDSLGMAESDLATFRNNGGGHLNHSFFWSILGPKKSVDEVLQKRIVRTFGSVDMFKEQFSACALSRFGSGWVWLVQDASSSLKLYSTANQDSPYLQKHIPLIGLDVWEHAYYLKYQNRRAEYVSAFWNVLKLV
ncbi:MAG: superoxide dismutase [Candidatus Roizmanbacteria bacterium]|nr:superoxide dismutase [Candidatus Roizmanbacteria bacterium]